MMKTQSIRLISLFLLMAGVSDAHAVACAKGVYRAGCAGPNGAVVAPAKPPVVVAPKAPVVVVPPKPVVVAPAAHCRMVNGVRVCR